MKTNSLPRIRHLASAAVAVLCLSAGAGAYASDVPARTVRYSDLDVGTQTGATALYNRIRRAANEVCGDVSSRQLAEAAAARACVDRAIVTSVRTVNDARLTSVYERHLGASGKTIRVTALR